MKKDIKYLEYLLREINHEMNLVTRCYLNNKGITMSRFWVLNKLKHDKPTTMKELQRKLLLSPGTLTGLIDNLVDDEFVERWRDSADRRLVFLKLTDKGENFLNNILEFRSSKLKDVINNGFNVNINNLNENLEELLKLIEKSDTNLA